MNLLRERIKRGDRLCGTIVCLTDPCLCEVFGNIGYDFIWIDMEHTYLSYRDVLCHLNAARSTGTPAIVRVPQNDLTATKKVMEMGAEGIIFPMGHTAKEVREWIEMTLYPPHGTRGFGPMRAIGYGKDDVMDYVERKSLDFCRFVQIEHVDCVENLEEIAAIEHLDGFIFGPNDLSGSLGELGHVFDEATVSRIKRAIGIARKHGKYVGLAGGYAPETIRFWSELGVDMLTVGADWNFVYEQGKRTLADLHKIHLKKD
jgi:2-dehydro-3-deoxyglucarate aldolase/4-hydroxy-2-oxoheptanedioate aldolase